MKISFVYVTAANRDEGLKIASHLLHKKLVACANLSGEMTSVYEWQGQLTESQEISILLKTRHELVDVVIQEVKTIHSYECPCIVSTDIVVAEPSFLEWVYNSTISAT